MFLLQGEQWGGPLGSTTPERQPQLLGRAGVTAESRGYPLSAASLSAASSALYKSHSTTPKGEFGTFLKFVSVSLFLYLDIYFSI